MKPAILNFTGKIIQALCNMLVVIMVSNQMGDEGRGITAFFGVITAASLITGEIGGGSAIIYQFNRFRFAPLLSYAIILGVSASVVIPTIFLVTGKIEFIYWPWLVLASLALIAFTFACHLLLATKNINAFSWLQVVPVLLLASMLAVAIAVKFGDPMLYLKFYMIAYATGAMAGAFLLRGKILAYTDKNASPNFIDAVKPGFLNQAGHLASLIHNRLIYFLFPAAALGLYSNVLALGEALLLGAGSIGQILYAQNAGSAGKSNAQSPGWSRWILIALAITVLGSFFLLMIPQGWYVSLFSTEFNGLKSLMPQVLLAINCYVVYLMLSYYFSTKGSFAMNLKLVLLALLIQVAGTAILYLTGRLNLENSIRIYAVSNALLAVLSFIMYTRKQPKH